MKFIKNYLKENLKWLLLVLACFGILCFVIGFEQVPLAQWGYAAFLCFFLYLLVVMIDFTRRYLHHKKLEKQTSEIAVTMDKLSLPRGQMETDYQELLRSLYITLQQQINELENGQVDAPFTSSFPSIPEPPSIFNALEEALNSTGRVTS